MKKTEKLRQAQQYDVVLRRVAHYFITTDLNYVFILF
jgi:hypothetical protein